MKSNFNDCLNRVLKDEGGFTNDPNDSGGPTNFGITISDVQRYVKRNATTQDVRNLTLDQAKSIYKSKYWDALGCDDLSSGVDYSVFDYGVNSGLGRPRKALQRFSSTSGISLIDAINNERTAFLRALAVSQPKDQKFLRGWLVRVSRVDGYSKQLAQKNNTAGSSITTTTVAATAGLATYFHDHLALILMGGFGAAIFIGFLVHYIINKGK